MSTNRPPAFQFYPRDWIASSAVTRMTPEQRGFYIQLLAYCWLDGSLPTDDRDLARMAGCSSPRWRAQGGIVREQFTEHDGRLYQRRLEREREKQHEYLNGASEHGKKGARARWDKMPEQCPSNARAMPDDGIASASAFASASASTRTADFDAFWEAYPLKVGKGSARKAYKALGANAELQARILDAIARQRQSRQWLKDGGQFIPHPTTWLHQGRWDDEPEPDVPQVNPHAAPVYAESWCEHDPRCASPDVHALVLAREREASDVAF